MKEDYPRNLVELEARFSTEEACREYLLKLRWPEGFVCPRCGIQSSWASKRNLLLCADCGYQASVTAGTIFQDTRKPLTLWFRAAWWVTTQKGGASALELQRVLGLGSYVTAWTWLHKFRRAMVRPGRNRLVGRVEVDETYVGGVEEGVRGREMVGKALVAVAAEEDGRGMGRIRLRRIADASAASLEAFVEEAIQPGSLVHTDGWEGYAGLENKGYRHEVTVLRGKRQSASKLLPRVHRVASLLKRWLLGTHQGAVSHEYLDYYLDEFTFRFNRRTSRSRGKLLSPSSRRSPPTLLPIRPPPAGGRRRRLLPMGAMVEGLQGPSRPESSPWHPCSEVACFQYVDGGQCQENFMHWWVTTQKGGASALHLARLEAAQVMVRPGRNRPETSESTRSRNGWQSVRRLLPRRMGAVWVASCRRIVKAWMPQRFYWKPLSKTYPPGSLVCTADGWELCGIGEQRIPPWVTVLRGKRQSASKLLPRVHRVASLLKRWLLFRFNRRTSRSRGKLFYRLLQQAVAADPAPYKTMVEATRAGTPTPKM